MKIHRIDSAPPPELARSLAEFEKEFLYPLGPSETFFISHGEDYTRFFRGMGNARIYLAEISGKIVGSLAAAGRTIVTADGKSTPAAYLCDVKVIGQMRGRTVLGRLALAAKEDITGASYEAAFSVAMDGSIPSDTHTGRLGIPKFELLGKLAVLRFDTSIPLGKIHFPPGAACGPCHRISGGDPAIASEMPPRALTVPGASGTLLDTRRGKRLWQSGGGEMISVHLAELQFNSPEALAELIRLALRTASGLGFPGIFTALPADSHLPAALVAAAGGTATLAGACVFGSGLPRGNWIVNTSEI